MKPKIIGFICCYNEVDIIEETLLFYERAGVPVVFVDNGSTDGTGECAQRYLRREILEYVQRRTEEYDLRDMLDLALSVAEKHRPDWIMHIDADHLYEPGSGFDTFFEHAQHAEALGCNVIDFDEYVFFPTSRDDSSAVTVYDRIKHYAYRPGRAGNSDGPLLMQPRLYRYVAGMNISDNGGHSIRYPQEPVVIHPTHGILRHYMFRSPEQGRAKLRARRARYSKAGRARGWHAQYDAWSEADSAFRRDAESLSFRREGSAWNRQISMLPDGSITGAPRANDAAIA